MKDFIFQSTYRPFQGISLYLKWLIAIATAYVFSICVYFVFFGDSSTDLCLSWINAKNLLNGSDIYDDSIYKQVSTMASAQYGVDSFDMAPHYFPSCYALLAPFALLNWPAAKAFWLLINLWLTHVLAKETSNLFCSGKHYLFLLAALILSQPWRVNICFGQTAIWSFGFFLLSLRFQEQNKIFFSGITLSLALLKYSLTLPLCLYFLIYKRVWKNVILALGIHFLVHCVFSLYLHKSIFYLFMATLKWCGNGIIQVGRFDLFHFWFSINPKLYWMPYFCVGIVFLIYLFALYKKKEQPQDDFAVFVLSSMVSTILTYHSESDYVIVLLPVAWILTRKNLNLSIILFSIGVFLTGYLRNYFPPVWKINPHQVMAKTNLMSTLNSFVFHSDMHTVVEITYSLFWYFSISILSYQLIRQKSEAPLSNDQRTDIFLKKF